MNTINRPTIEQAFQDFIADRYGGTADYIKHIDTDRNRAIFMTGAAAAISALGIEAAKIEQDEPEKPFVQPATGSPPLHYVMGNWEALFDCEFRTRTADYGQMHLILTYKSLRLALTREDFQALQSIFTQMKWPE